MASIVNTISNLKSPLFLMLIACKVVLYYNNNKNDKMTLSIFETHLLILRPVCDLFFTFTTTIETKS
jgi:hypothetical protein